MTQLVPPSAAVNQLLTMNDPSVPLVCVDYSRYQQHVSWGAAVVIRRQNRNVILLLGGLIDARQLSQDGIGGETEAQLRCAQALLSAGVERAALFTDERSTGRRLGINVYQRDTPLGARAHQVAGLIRLNLTEQGRAFPSHCWSLRPSDWARRGVSEEENIQLARLHERPLRVTNLAKLVTVIEKRKAVKRERHALPVACMQWRQVDEDGNWLQSVKFHFEVLDRSLRQARVEVSASSRILGGFTLKESCGAEQGRRENRSRRKLRQLFAAQNMALSDEDCAALGRAMWAALRSAPAGRCRFQVRADCPEYARRLLD